MIISVIDYQLYNKVLVILKMITSIYTNFFKKVLFFLSLFILQEFINNLYNFEFYNYRFEFYIILISLKHKS